jgi:hypothetical protein
MPLISIEYDDAKIPDTAIVAVSEAVRNIVSEATDIADVFVYANSARVKIQIAPLEIFVQISEEKAADLDGLFETLTKRISSWKRDAGFEYPINFTLIPMKWRFAVDI